MSSADGRAHSFWRYAVLLAVTGGVLAVLVHELAGASEVAMVALGASPLWVAASFGLALVTLPLAAERWRAVLRAMGHSISFKRSLAVVIATWPLLVVTPSRANEFLRAVAVRDVVPVFAGAGSVLAEKTADLFLLLVIGAIGTALHGLWLWTGLLALAAVGTLAIIAALRVKRDFVRALPLVRNKPERADQLFEAFDALLRSPGDLAMLCGSSLVIRFIGIAILHTLLIAVGARVSLFETLTTWPVAVLVGLAPVTLAGMGTRDAAFIYILSTKLGADVSASHLLAATMGYSVVAIWSIALLGLPLMVREGAKRAV